MRPAALALLSLSAVVGACGAARSSTPASSRGAGDSAVSAVDASTTLPQDRPLVVVVHAEWCAACRRAAPAIAWLHQEYGDRVTFVDLDVTDDDALAQAAAKASRCGLGLFFKENRGLPGVTILGRDRKEVHHFAAEYRGGPYRSAVEAALLSFERSAPQP